MTELEYLLLADSVYLNLKLGENLYTAVDKAIYENKNRNKRILKGLALTPELAKAEVVATRYIFN